MSTKNELELRPLEAHELDIVNGAGEHINATGTDFLSNFYWAKLDLMNYGWYGDATTVSKPIQLLADGSGPANTRWHVFPS